MREEIRSIIENKTRDRIRVYLDSRDRWRFARSLTNLTEEAAHEYGTRFLVELIQNAYDAQPSQRSDGIVRIVLDETEGSFGVLYVANSGSPFSAENFEALSNIAQSDKTPGEGIGNKGIGFRSVLQVCEAPEVFSTTAARRLGEPSDGFCFGFAKEVDLRRHTNTAEEFDVVREDLTRYLLPVPIEATNGRVQELLDAGCVTVVRLPLKGAPALEAAQEQVELAADDDARLLLFLDRLRALEITRISGDRAVNATCVARSSKTVGGMVLHPSVQAEEVDLQENRFLVFRQAIGASEIQKAVAKSIEVGALRASWSKWEADAEVAVAVACDFDAALTPAMFTFLPMGPQAAAPFHGFLNAPFYTKLARVDLDEAVPLNSFLLDRAADLCVVAINALKNSERPDRFTAVCDLLTWNRQHLERLKGAFARTGYELEKAPVVPAVDRQTKTSWCALADAFVWDKEGLELMDSRRVARRVGVSIVLQSLGSKRMRRLRDLRQRCLGADMIPSSETIASWMEAVARDLAAKPFNAARWNAFYRDLDRIFGIHDASALQGRYILIDSRERLLAAGPWDQEGSGEPTTAVFFPPRRRAEQGSSEDEAIEDEEDIDVPARLARAITYLHGDIVLTNQEGSRRSRNAVRSFLERSRLVLPYRRRAVIEHVAQLLLRSKGEQTHREALLWAFRQFEATGGDIRDLRSVPLRVPTSSGWIRARLATFGRGWPKTLGGELEGLLESLRETDESARELYGRLIVGPDSWVPASAKVSTLTSFLKSLGVMDGLFPLALPRRRLEMEGRFYSPTYVAASLDVDSVTGDQWELAIGDQPGAPRNPYTPYRSSALWVLPGQQSYLELDRRTRALFAGLLLESVGAWPDECLEFTFERFRSGDHRRYPDTQRWPSPAWAFVSAAPWIPMADPRRRAETYFTNVSRAWHHDDSGTEVAPRFARLIPLEFRRRIERNSQALPKLTAAGLRTWNAASSAKARLTECADLIAGGHLTEGDVSGVRRACRDAWHDLVTGDKSAGENDLEALALVVSRGHELGIVHPEEQGDELPTKVYIPAGSRGIVAQVLEGLEAKILEVEPQDGLAVRALLRSRLDLDVVPIADVVARYIADGEIVRPGPDRPLLFSAEDSWVIDVILIVLDLQSSQFVRVTEQTLRRAAEKLRCVRVWWASKVEVEVDGQVVDLPSHTARSLAINDDDHPLVIGTPSVRSLTWDVLECLSTPLAELIGNRLASREILLACVRLARVLDGVWREPSKAEIAHALELPLERIVGSLASLRQDLVSAVHHTAAVVAHFEGLEAARRLLEGLFEDEASLARALEGFDNLPVSAAELVLDARTVSDLGQIRRLLGIDFAEFNRTLHALGPPFLPISDRDHHAQVLQHFVSANRKRILDSLRERFADDFRSGKPLDEYVALGRLEQFEVPEEWPESYETPSDELMSELVDSWLVACGAPRMGACTTHLEDLDSLRRRNESFVGKVLPKLGQLVTAWCKRNGEEVPGGWFFERDSGPTAESLLRGSGRLDFMELEEKQVIEWLSEGSFWPVAMPHRTDLQGLGLDAEALDQGQREQEAREAEKRRAARSVVLDGESLDAAEANYQEIAAKVQSSVSANFLEASKRPASLAEIRPRKIAPSVGRGRGGARRERLSNEQKAAIGLIGEVLAYEWLSSRYPNEVTPDSWVSGYRCAVLGGHEGDDSLGYDFEVVQKSQTLRFEVKATSTETCEFELTESELRAAQAARRGIYRIVFICDVLNTARRTLHILPNPFDDDSRGKYRVMNEGLRYRFDLEQDRDEE